MSEKEASLNKQIKNLTKTVQRLVDAKRLDELKGHLPVEEEPEETSMLKVNTQEFDMFGDPVVMITSSRLHGDDDAFDFANSFVVGKHHRMMGNRYGKHSLLIKKEYFDEGKIDPYLISAFPHRVIEIVENGERVEYYKIRMLVTDMQAAKLLLTRIPTGEGLARMEEIWRNGTANFGPGFTQEKTPIPPQYAPSNTYGKLKKPEKNQMISKETVEQGFKEEE